VFITLEGPEGGGKSTQMRPLVEFLSQKGFNVLSLREPGGTPTGDRIRDILLDGKTDVDPRAEVLLFAASRAQIVADVIRPYLDSGGIVVCDRYADSTMAYQGYGRRIDLNLLRQITAFATGNLMPDLTLYLDIDPAQGLLRRNRSGEALDRLDSETLDFHRRVRAGYLELIAAEPHRWITIDASQSSDVVRQRIEQEVLARLEIHFSGQG
jgi:dTMP kinase